VWAHSTPICRPSRLRTRRVALQARPRSADRTRSPAAISQKREFFKCPPETIGYLPRECLKSEPGDWWPVSKSPPLAGLSASIRDSFSKRATAWLEREDSNSRIPDRTQSLRANRGIRELTKVYQMLEQKLDIDPPWSASRWESCFAFRLSQQCKIQ
jgi:hypothetical protein